jgi:mannose-6-phosphate isomerase-like protein (cupin superfamily)
LESVFNIRKIVAEITASPRSYRNVALCTFNDQVLRLSLMTQPYFWHVHPDSDELFIGLLGVVLLETESGVVELRLGDAYVVPKGTKHRTSPTGSYSVNLTVEGRDMTTIKV